MIEFNFLLRSVKRRGNGICKVRSKACWHDYEVRNGVLDGSVGAVYFGGPRTERGRFLFFRFRLSLIINHAKKRIVFSFLFEFDVGRTKWKRV